MKLINNSNNTCSTTITPRLTTKCHFMFKKSYYLL